MISALFFQFYNLIQNLTALENVELASQISKNPLDAAETLKKVGLEERMSNFPAQLSGGEQQRVRSPGRLQRIPSCCCAMSLRARWIIIRGKRF